MKHVVLSLSFFLSTMIYAQKVNDFQYVIVPNKYDAMKTADEYQVNGLSKFLLNKYGFDAYLESDDKPFAMKDAVCDVLYADLMDDSNFIYTRVFFLLKDCEGNTVFKTQEGRSKLKAYRPAYNEAIREAFEDIRALQYSYKGTHKEGSLSSDYIKEKKEITEEQLSTQESTPIDQRVASAPLQPLTDTNLLLEGNQQDKEDKPVLYASEDGFYKAVSFGNSITFYERDDTIGSATTNKNDTFAIKTSQFEGTGYFKEGQLIVARRIKGVVGDVQMIFTKK